MKNKVFKNLKIFSFTVLSFLFLTLFANSAYALNVLESDLNRNGVPDSTEVEVVASTTQSLSAGEYYFNNLIITSNATLTLDGAPLSADSFKGVKINATNITITSGARISADGQGYTRGSGFTPLGTNAGASYGGAGGGNTATSTYGSAMMPMDLGSGTSGYRGGGAIRLAVTGTLLVNGDISSNGGGYRTSGGSIYVTTNNLTGTGTFNASGGSTSWPYSFAGGGGRIAVHYQQSSFNGRAKANAGVYCFYGCNPAGGAGTVAFFDTMNNDVYIKGYFRFQTNDAPFNFRNVTLEDNVSAEIEKDIPIAADSILIRNSSSMTVKNGSTVNTHSLTLEQNSYFTISDAPILSISLIDIGQGSTLVLSGNETLVSDTMNIKNGGTLTVEKEHVLFLTITNLNIALGGTVSANLKGYSTGFGSGIPGTPSAGASYGGAGLWNTASSTYGSSTAPIDFGSGGNGYHTQGGGAIRLIVNNELLNNGTVSADGGNTSSGGSIYVTADKMFGVGSYRANGGGFYCPNSCFGMGGGGRVAIYYSTSSFNGGVFAKGGCNSFDGWTMTCGGGGTVVLKQIELGCKTNCYSNVLFLPGLEASRLYNQDGLFENQLWEPNRDADVEKLFLNPDGTPIRNDIYTRDVIDNAYIPKKGDIYKSFLADLDTWKNTDHIINDYTITPYDWRLFPDYILNRGIKNGENISYSSTTTSPYIIQELRRLAKSSKTGRVTVIAHSNGGLLAKALTNKLGAEASLLIDKIIFVAVPQEGTPKAIGAILHGYDQGLPLSTIPLTLSLQTARKFAENMPSAYNLLPSENYFARVSTPVVTFDSSDILEEFRARYGTTINSIAGLKNFVTDGWRSASSSYENLVFPSVGNADLFSQAEAVHSVLDLWIPPKAVQFYQIAGWGVDTLATIEYKEGKKTTCKMNPPSFPFTKSYCTYVTAPTIIYNPKEVIDGDDTVVSSSALSGATSTANYWVDLREYDKLIYGNIDRKHADILEVPELRTLIQGLIVNSTSMLPVVTFVKPYQPAFNPTDPANKRLRFLLHSPLHLSATDSLGNITSSATSTIPGSRFTRYGEVQVLKVPKGTPITLNLTGYASGSFTLDVQEIDGSNNILASTTFAGIPSATSTTATMTFPNGTIETASSLIVDYDNNGTTDFTLNPRVGNEVVFDTTPPEARISFSTSTQKLLIDGIDASGETTVSTTDTSALIVDLSGNTMGITFSQLKQERKEIKMQIEELYYNGISTSTIPKTTLQYEWSTDKQGNLKELKQKATVGALKIEAHYDGKKNVTTITIKTKEKEDHDERHEEQEKEVKQTFPGVKIIGLMTDKGRVTINF